MAGAPPWARGVLATRRATLIGAAYGLAGCGFRPVYAPAAPGTAAGDAAAELAAINVKIIPERAGQLLRQDLQQRLEGTGGEVAKRYDLAVSFTFTQEGINILPDNTASRFRYTAAAAYVLQRQDAGQQVVTSGSAHLTDAANVIDNQYFASDLETQTVLRRIAASLADQITLRIAAYFRAHPQPA